MDHSEMEEILFRDLDATSISDTLMLVDENEVSMDLAIIPNGMTPYELLCTLTEETQLMIFCERNEARDPKWTPHYGVIPASLVILFTVSVTKVKCI